MRSIPFCCNVSVVFFEVAIIVQFFFCFAHIPRHGLFCVENRGAVVNGCGLKALDVKRKMSVKLGVVAAHVGNFLMQHDATNLGVWGTNQGKPIETGQVPGSTFSCSLNRCSAILDLVCLVRSGSPLVTSNCGDDVIPRWDAKMCPFQYPT